MYVCMYVCMYVRTLVCICIHIYACGYVCLYVCVCMHVTTLKKLNGHIICIPQGPSASCVETSEASPASCVGISCGCALYCISIGILVSHIEASPASCVGI